jgi:hypothetical protein
VINRLYPRAPPAGPSQLVPVGSSESILCVLTEVEAHDYRSRVDGRGRMLVRGMERRYRVLPWTSSHFSLPASSAPRVLVFCGSLGRTLGGFAGCSADELAEALAALGVEVETVGGLGEAQVGVDAGHDDAGVDGDDLDADQGDLQLQASASRRSVDSNPLMSAGVLGRSSMAASIAWRRTIGVGPSKKGAVPTDSPGIEHRVRSTRIERH